MPTDPFDFSALFRELGADPKYGAHKEQIAALTRVIDKQREKIAELEARCSRLARLHAQRGA